jgi:putative SOS response-associated peptidase YedK
MCGAYGFSVKDAKEVNDRFSVVNTLEGLKARYNLRPGQMNPVITAHSPNQISSMFWGLIPHFVDDRNYSYKYSTINAKAETVATLRTYREPLRRSRCIVPATGFYEPDKEHGKKSLYPWHYFRLKREDLFAFAGLYDTWKDRQTGKELHSYTIITTTPNAVVGAYHHRMPVILHREDEAAWLNPDIAEPAELLPLLKPYPEEEMEEWRVSDAARSYKNDYPELIKPYVDEPQKSKPEQGRLL